MTVSSASVSSSTAPASARGKGITFGGQLRRLGRQPAEPADQRLPLLEQLVEAREVVAAERLALVARELVDAAQQLKLGGGGAINHARQAPARRRRGSRFCSRALAQASRSWLLRAATCRTGAGSFATFASSSRWC